MARKRMPSSSPASMALTMFGWFSLADVCTSCLNRATASSFSENFSGRILTATWRFIEICVARYTSPIPPLPRRRMNLKPAMVVPAPIWKKGIATAWPQWGHSDNPPLRELSASRGPSQAEHKNLKSIRPVLLIAAHAVKQHARCRLPHHPQDQAVVPIQQSPEFPPGF